MAPRTIRWRFIWGRLKAGRGDLISRFTRDSFGSTNAHGHTTVCQGSLYFTCKAMADQFVEGKFTGGLKFYWQADAQNSEFIIFVGASPLEGNYGPTHRSKPAALQVDAQIEASCAQSGEPIRLSVTGGQVQASDALAHFLVPFKDWYGDLSFT